MGAREQRGPLDGVPVTVKENFVRAGIPAHAGVAGTAGVIPERDSPVVERLLEQGAVIVGSTTMPDWGMLSSGVSSLSGITRSPWNPEWTVGGSSAGAGAAAAAGFGAVHLGTDIGGSVRLPAAWTGVATLKPSNGRIPLDNPYFGRSAGPLARTVADVALGMHAVARPDERDYTSLPDADIDWLDLDTDVRAAASPCTSTRARACPSTPRFGRPCCARRISSLMPEPRSWSCRRSSTTASCATSTTSGASVSGATYLGLSHEAKIAVLPYIADWVHPGSDMTGRRALEAYETFGELQKRTVAATSAFDGVLAPVAPVAAFPAEWPIAVGLRRERGHVAHRVHAAVQHVGAAGVVGELRVHRGRAADRVADLGAAVRGSRDAAVDGLVRGGAAGGCEAGVSGLRCGGGCHGGAWPARP